MQDTDTPSPPTVGGATRLFAVLGDPVRQVRAPALLNALFARLGLDAVLVPVHAPADRLDMIVRGLQAMANLDGLLITVPHKAAALDLADAATPAARLAGGANAMRREPDGSWLAANFDGAGFVKGLISCGHPPAGLRVALVGAGGAGGAIAAALLGAGAARVDISDLEPARAHALAVRMARHHPDRVGAAGAPRLAGVDLAVNATPLGMRPGDPLPFDPSALPAAAVVADVVMKPSETRLLRAAAALGHPIHHGAHMLDEQIGLYRTFFGLDAARGPDPAPRTTSRVTAG